MDGAGGSDREVSMGPMREAGPVVNQDEELVQFHVLLDSICLFNQGIHDVQGGFNSADECTVQSRREVIIHFAIEHEILLPAVVNHDKCHEVAVGQRCFRGGVLQGLEDSFGLHVVGGGEQVMCRCASRDCEVCCCDPCVLSP